MRLEWKGREVLTKVRNAAIRGVNETMEAAVDVARDAAPVRTGELRDSIKVQDPAHRDGARIVGRWGTRTKQGIFQEIGTVHHPPQPFLRPSADREYPRLAARIKEALR